MRCPFCGHSDSKVIDSRPADDGNAIRRRRECIECEKRFTTYEKVESLPLIVIKKDGSKEVFDQRKLVSGILKACHKRPVDAEALAADVEAELTNSLCGEVRTDEIGKMVLSKLRGLDAVSYVRYASVYRDFDDIKSFLDELEAINNQSEKK